MHFRVIFLLLVHQAFFNQASTAPSHNSNGRTFVTPPVTQIMSQAAIHAVGAVGSVMVAKGAAKAVKAYHKCKEGDRLGAAEECSQCMGCMGHGGALLSGAYLYGRTQGHFDRRAA